MHQLLLDAALCRPDGLAFRWVDRDRQVTFADAVRLMEAMAGGLHALGVARGDRVTIVAHNGLDYLVTMLGCWRLGAIAALVNVRFKDELAGYFADHTPTVVVYTHDIHAQVVAAAAHSPGLRRLVCMDGPMDGADGLPDLLAAQYPAPPDPWDETAIAHLAYTSGTTGLPKGACLAHEPTVRAARCIGERLRLTAADVSFGPTALSSSYQLVANLLPPLAALASINVMGRWTVETGFAALEAAGATMLVANPPLLLDLLAASRAYGRPPAGLRLAVSGGAPLPLAIKRAFRDELGLPIAESYGQSELGGFMALGRPELEPDDQRLAAIGRPLPDKEVAVFGPDDARLPPGEIGEVVLRGGCMTGYWNRSEATAAATRGGWLRSGDLGVMDATGALTLRGRKSELITVDGIAWYPRDIEEALTALPGIREAALVGVPDSELGQRPVVYLALEPGRMMDPTVFRRTVQRTLPYRLEHMEFVAIDAMPMTPTGKIAKAELAQRAAADRPGGADG